VYLLTSQPLLKSRGVKFSKSLCERFANRVAVGDVRQAIDGALDEAESLSENQGGVEFN
jgi:hypothetical protein